MREKPSAIPSMCRSVPHQPKAAPDAMTMKLFGPGVIEVTKAKFARASRVPECSKGCPLIEKTSPISLDGGGMDAVLRRLSLQGCR